MKETFLNPFSTTTTIGGVISDIGGAISGISDIFTGGSSPNGRSTPPTVKSNSTGIPVEGLGEQRSDVNLVEIAKKNWMIIAIGIVVLTMLKK